MKRIRLIPRLDSRLVEELRPQRKLIVKGLVCAVFVSLLNNAPLPLLGASLNAITEAAPANRRDPEIEGPAKQAKHRKDDPLSAIKDRFKGATDALVGGTLGKAPPLERLAVYCLLVVAIFAAKYFFVRASMVSLSKAAARLSNGLRLKLFTKLQRLPISYFGRRRAGAIQSVLTNDVNVYTGAIGVLRDSIEAPLTMLGALAFVLWKQPLLAVVGVAFVIPMSALIRANGKRIKSSQLRVQSGLSDLSAVTSESLQGVRVVKAFAAERKIEREYSDRLHDTYVNTIDNARITASLRPLVELIGATAVSGVLYFCGWLTSQDKLDVGTIAAIIFAFDRINQGLRSITGITSTLNSIDAATEHIHREVLDIPDQVDDTNAGQILELPKGRIEFENVSFAYPDGTEALRSVSFTLEPGTSLALVGPSGAGKSTVADLLLRFYDPSSGRILFDGVDVRELNLKWLREQIGVVPQQTFLFAGSIAENIRLGKPDATDEEIATASQRAHVEEFVQHLPARYESPLGEGGSGLSGGQRQRVAIARALVREPSLLLLDEATSALDAESERAVTEALDEVMQQRTTLFIAHRLTTAARANRILVMAHGEVKETGSHAELLQKGGAYAGLFAAFSGGVL